MKKLFLLIFCVAIVSAVDAQSYSSHVYLSTVYSENGEYYLKSIPWDNEIPSTRGTTTVYRKNGSTVYSLPRGFDNAGENRLILSNDGQTIFYVTDWGANEEKDGLKSISIYKKGVLIAGFTETEINGCDKTKERCRLVYSNYEAVVDIDKTRAAHKRILKESIDPKERFLSDYAVFLSGDTVYLIDSKKNVHTFDLQTGKHLGPAPFDTEYDRLRPIARTSKTESETFKAPLFMEFPKVGPGKETNAALAEHLGMKLYNIYGTKDEKYKRYGFEIAGYLRQDGSVEIENIEFYGGELPKEKIIEFFTSNRFDSSSMPGTFEKWYFRDESFFFRKADDRLARQEQKAEMKIQRAEHAKRMISESIDGRYIPKDLGECFVELDKLLNEVNRKEMSALKDRSEMGQHHLGLGMWLRNNWGLWGGSRLQKYFTDRGVTHPDNMSGVILDHYYDWLHGEKDTWKEWEKAANRPN